MALIEMNSSESFQTDEQHKDAGMDFTIVMATFPADGDPVPPQESAAGTDKLMLLHVAGGGQRVARFNRHRVTERLGRDTARPGANRPIVAGRLHRPTTVAASRCRR